MTRNHPKGPPPEAPGIRDLPPAEHEDPKGGRFPEVTKVPPPSGPVPIPYPNQ